MQLLINIPAKAMRYQYLAIKGLCITQKKITPTHNKGESVWKSFQDRTKFK